VVTTKEKIQAKLRNRSRDVYIMHNLTTNSIINSRDIIWLNKTYGEWKNNKATISTVEDDTIELPTGIDKLKLTTNATMDTEDESNELDKKVHRAMKKLESWFNPQATKVVEDYNHGREIKLDQVNLFCFLRI
jgi:hypothetical protein